MQLKIGKELLRDLDGRSNHNLERWNIDARQVTVYGKSSVSIDLDEMSDDLVKEFQKLVEPSKAHGAKGMIFHIKQHLKANEELRKGNKQGFDRLAIYKLEHLATYLKRRLQAEKKHRVYVYDSKRGVTFCSYIYRVRYNPAEHRRDYTIPEYVTFTLAWKEFGELQTETYTFHREEVYRKNIVEVLRGRNISFPNKADDEAYEASVAKFESIVTRIGMQHLASGAGTDDVDESSDRRWWWRSADNIILDREGEPSNVVVDVFSEDDKEEDDRHSSRHGKEVDLTWWRINAFEDDPVDPESPDDELPVHPMLVIFALKKQVRLRVHVEQLEEYVYDDSMGDKLILPDESTKLVRTLLAYDGGFQDIVKNKGGGAIVLCTGIAGTGKTLTAEVYAEVMHRPLYTVQCSQLGVDPEQLEKELLKIFSRSERWGAILLLDEADVYIRERGNDLQQNAVVGVFLRVLEYYHGVLFMTTNREKDIDDAIASRCIARISYTVPESEEKLADIWRVLAEVQGFTYTEATIKKLARSYNKLTGRDIKNLLKLVKLTDGTDQPLSIKTIEFVKQFKPTRGVYD